MKQDVNLLLLGLLVFILMAMAVMAIYAQGEYRKLGDDYASALKNLSDKKEELNNRSQELMLLQGELNEREALLAEVVHELNLTKEKQQSLGGYYEDIKGVKETLEDDLTKTEQEKQTYESKFNAKVKELEVCNKNAALKDTQLKQEKEKTAQVLVSMNLVSSQLNSTKKEIDKALSYIDAVQSNITKLNRMVDSAQSVVRGFEPPDDISEAAKDDIEDDLDKIEKYIGGELQKSINNVRDALDG